MTNYQCSECLRPIGLMVDEKGKPEIFLCPHTGRPAETQPRGVRRG
jgi:hypothetical protein